MRARVILVLAVLCCVPVFLPLRASEEASSEEAEGFAGLRYHLRTQDQNGSYAGVIEEFAIPSLGIVFNYSIVLGELNCFFATPRIENREEWAEFDERVLHDPEPVVVPMSLALALLEVATLERLRLRQAGAALEHVRAIDFK